MNNNNECPICGTPALKQEDYNSDSVFYDCPVCGRYEFAMKNWKLPKFNENHLGAYLVYNGFLNNGSEFRFFTTKEKEWCDEWKEKFSKGDYTHGHPVHLSVENVENWYPKTFAEKIDYILLYLNSHIQHIGESVNFKGKEIYGVLFVDRFDYKDGKYIKREITQMQDQVKFMREYLKEKRYITYPNTINRNYYEDMPIALAPEGYARVDELQKNTSNGKNVLVAMKFGDDTKPLREAIRKGISDAGYLAIFIDEVEHNDFITPELLKYIRDSKFVVVDLTHMNNGAYFEEGYAMGIGKQVIQLCRRDVQLHFDIAQKNTIMWDKEEDISDKLKNRIIATID